MTNRLAAQSGLCLQDLLVLYRQIPPSASQLVKLKQRILGPNKDESTAKYQQRNQIMMRIYRDIPVPSWKVVFPNKLLQFRPLDGLRSDLVSIAGLLCKLFSAPAATALHALPAGTPVSKDALHSPVMSAPITQVNIKG